MAFGQSSGPPASARQVQELLGLLADAGYGDFRDARGPMGFNQRQAGGRFTHDEAAALIEQLQTEAEQGQPTAGDPPGQTHPTPAPRLSATERTLRAIPAERLAAELSRRGWVVMEP